MRKFFLVMFLFLVPTVVLVEPGPPNESQTKTRIDHHLSQFNSRLKGTFYDVIGNTFIKASYNLWKLDTGSSRADPELETFRIEYGWRF